MCCVIPPASPAATSVSRMASSSDVLPWSTWPITVTTGGRSPRGSAEAADSAAAPRGLLRRRWALRAARGLRVDDHSAPPAAAPAVSRRNRASGPGGALRRLLAGRCLSIVVLSLGGLRRGGSLALGGSR